MIDPTFAAQLAAWITPAMLIDVLAWLRADIRRSEDRQLELMAQMEKRQKEHTDQMEGRLKERIDKVDNRVGRVEERMGGLEREVAELKGKIHVIQRYVMGRNEPAAGPAD